MKRYLLQLFIGFSVLVIAGCGFQLRGSADLPTYLQTLYIQGIPKQQDLGLMLKRSLTQNGVTVLNDYQAGSAVLTILDHKLERRVLSVGSDAKVSEYELFAVVKFKVSDSSGKVLVESAEVTAQRDYQFDQEQVLGKDEEEQLLRDQIHQQLVQSILRRLTAL